MLRSDDSGDLSCIDVRGFRDAVNAAYDPRAAAPLRLAVVGPEADTAAWLDAWAEDVERVRRTILVSRRYDGKEVVAVTTLAAHGYGVETSLAVESVSASAAAGARDILRSGVHEKSAIEAALARYDAEAE
ncbi:MAG TPA: hypothetical protein VHB21_13450 [Minicystis sp.]|nr:hypothetical protein [Minicystis sp.]